jgi:hypothetical protein
LIRNRSPDHPITRFLFSLYARCQTRDGNWVSISCDRRVIAQRVDRSCERLEVCLHFPARPEFSKSILRRW